MKLLFILTFKLQGSNYKVLSVEPIPVYKGMYTVTLRNKKTKTLIKFDTDSINSPEKLRPWTTKK